ncbi:hypothetical protein CFE70_003091 [Pyrenophora teres f. teres 0-1]
MAVSSLTDTVSTVSDMVRSSFYGAPLAATAWVSTSTVYDRGKHDDETGDKTGDESYSPCAVNEPVQSTSHPNPRCLMNPPNFNAS